MEILSGVVGLWIIYAVVKHCIEEGIKSWRTKDEFYRLDCIGIPICAWIFGIATLLLILYTLAWLVSPALQSANPNFLRISAPVY